MLAGSLLTVVLLNSNSISLQNCQRFSKLRIVSRNNSAEDESLGKYQTRSFKFPLEIKSVRIEYQDGNYPKVFNTSGDDIGNEINDYKDKSITIGQNANPQGRKIGEKLAEALTVAAFRAFFEWALSLATQ